ncbi:MAG: hypothetical protein IJ248_03370 [Candidatus Methanomethylophilaceae archaeon]|nr:hypothetical protein [Candidatus Methanomethylophilaceae archaeon]
MQLDEEYFRESFKGVSFRGKRLRQMEDPIRGSYRRGSAASMNGISPEQICTVTGIDDMNQFFFDVCCRSRPTSDILFDVLRERICDGAIVNTDRLNSYPKALNELNVAVHNRYVPASHEGLNKVNALHSRVRLFLRRFNGVSTKWLCHYLAWMKWLSTFVKGRSLDKSCEIISKHIIGGEYGFRTRTVPFMPIPFRDRELNELKTYCS